MNWFTTAGAGGARDAGTRPGDHAMCGAAVMYDAGKIITFGGATAYNVAKNGAVATATSVLITLTGTQVATKVVGDLNKARSYVNGVVLPDGKVLAIGGEFKPIPFNDQTPVYETGACLRDCRSLAQDWITVAFSEWERDARDLRMRLVCY